MHSQRIIEHSFGSMEWRKSGVTVPLLLGRRCGSGDRKLVIADLAADPCVLITGRKGSGKTVMLSTIIPGLVQKFSRNRLRLLVFSRDGALDWCNGLPQMLQPVVKDPSKLPGALSDAIKEMDARKCVFAGAKTWDIAGYNGRSLISRFHRRDSAPRIMPYLVIMVDGLADELLPEHREELGCLFTRIAELGRDTGIYCIVATRMRTWNSPFISRRFIRKVPAISLDGKGYFEFGCDRGEIADVHPAEWIPTDCGELHDLLADSTARLLERGRVIWSRMKEETSLDFVAATLTLTIAGCIILLARLSDEEGCGTYFLDGIPRLLSFSEFLYEVLFWPGLAALSLFALFLFIYLPVRFPRTAMTMTILLAMLIYIIYSIARA